jgi:hypothetical protein
MMKKEVNRLCEKCSRKCKQLLEVELLGCKLFEAKPVQMTLDFFTKGRSKKPSKK